MVEIFQWRVGAAARVELKGPAPNNVTQPNAVAPLNSGVALSAEVGSAFARILFGDVDFVAGVVRNHAEWARKGLYLEKVAEVDGDVDLAYMLTNSLESNWFERNDPRLRVMGEAHRSTSVGDLMREGDRITVIAMVGHKAIDIEARLADTPIPRLPRP